jgi:hypothetical protein
MSSLKDLNTFFSGESAGDLDPFILTFFFKERVRGTRDIDINLKDSLTRIQKNLNEV